MERLFKLVIACAAVAGTVSGSSAAVFTIDFDYHVTGDIPSGSGPLATLTVWDVGADTVALRLDHNSGSAPSQFISSLWLNIDPIPGTIAQQGRTPANKFDGPFAYGTDSEFRAGLAFDARQDFVTTNAGGGANRLKPGEFITFELVGSGLSASAFLNPATPGQGQPDNILAMIHIQGIPSHDGSAHLGAVPEPASMATLGVGAAALLARRRRRRQG